MDIYGSFHYSVISFFTFIGCSVRRAWWVMTRVASSSRAPREKLLTNMAEAHKRRRVDNMNEVDHLLEHRFETLSLEEKFEVKRLGPHHPRDIGISQTVGKNIRTFNVEWFAKKKWLTASIQKKALFCFPCLLFGGSGGEVTWSRDTRI